jgi:hypothetical protein
MGSFAITSQKVVPCNSFQWLNMPAGWSMT